jgi:L-fucose isomerase-like protein
MKNCRLNYQVIMNRLMEEGREPVITRGTLEGQIQPGPVTLLRLQSTPDCELRSYLAEGEVLDVEPHTFGGTGVFAVAGFGRFYRHVLIGRHFPHHVAVGFARTGEVLYEVLKLLGVEEIGTPLPEGVLYAGENPFWQK